MATLTVKKLKERSTDWTMRFRSTLTFSPGEDLGLYGDKSLGWKPKTLKSGVTKVTSIGDYRAGKYSDIESFSVERANSLTNNMGVSIDRVEVYGSVGTNEATLIISNPPFQKV